MHKGLLSSLYSLKWLLLVLLVTGCHHDNPVPPPVKETTVTGQIMLGPVLRGHSLQLVIYDSDMNELQRPMIGLDGSYGFKLSEYKGVVIAQVTSANPEQCSGDYIDEATAEPKCLGNNTIVSTTVVDLDENNNENNQAELHTTPVTTVAAVNAGISINDDGTIAVGNISPEIIEQSNKTISRALGLGDQSVAEYRPKSIITTDQKFQLGDAYSNALAEISGIEAKGKSLNSIVKLISSSIGKNDKLSPAMQDMMVKGIQEVYKTAKDKGADLSILDQINQRQDDYTDSNTKVDLINAPEPPVFKNKTKTANQEPIWQWISGGTGNNRYRYRFGTELDLQSNRNWTNINSNKFAPSESLKQGRYILEIQEGHVSDPTKWSMVSSSTIEIIRNQKGSVSIQGEAIQGKKLIAKPFDNDGIQGEVNYQWYRDNQLIKNATKPIFELSHIDVNTSITVYISYIDNIDFHEKDIQSLPVKIDNIDDKPVLKKPSDVVLNEDDDTKVVTLIGNDIDNDDKAITYRIENYKSEIANVFITANNQLQIKPIPNQYGETTVTVTAESNDLVDQKSFKITVNNIDDKPVMTTVLKDLAFQEDSKGTTLSLAATDIDNPGKDIIFKVKHSNPSIANVFIAANNQLQIRPLANQYGETTVTVTAESNGLIDKKSFNLKITSENDAPEGMPYIKQQAKQGVPLTVDISKIDDPDGLTNKEFSYFWKADGDDITNGSASINTFTPTQDQVGKKISVTVKYRDDAHNLEIIKSNITNKVEDINDAPVAIHQTIDVKEQLSKTFKLNFNDVDDPAKDLNIKIIDQPDNGELITQPGVDITYTSTSDTAADDSFTYKVCDPDDLCSDQAKVTIKIETQNDAPVANDLYIDAKEQSPISIQLIGSDVDDPTEALTYQINDQPSHSFYIENPSEAYITYKSNSDTATSDSFTYKVCDPDNLCSQQARVTINIEAQNDVPVAKSLTVDNNENINDLSQITLSVIDADNDSLNFRITKLPKHGRLILHEGNRYKFVSIHESFKSTVKLSYTRISLGKDSFQYSANDGSTDSNLATVTISYKYPMGESFKFEAKEKIMSDKIALKNISDIEIKGYKITELPQFGDLYKNNKKIIDIATLITETDVLTYKSTSVDTDSPKSDSFKYKAYNDELESVEAATVSIIIFTDNLVTRTNKNEQGAEFVFVTNTDKNNNIDQFNAIQYKFQVANNHDGFESSRFMTLFTDNRTNKPFWLEQLPPSSSDDQLKLNVNFKVEDETIATSYIKGQITGLEKESLRVLFTVLDRDLDFIHKEGFIIKPTLEINEKTKRQNNTTWIDVCWQMSESLGIADSSILSIKDKIRQIVTNSWQKNAAIKFDWRNDNWDINNYSEFDYNSPQPSNCSESYNTDYPRIKVYFKLPNEDVLDHEEDLFTINIDIKDNEDIEDELFSKYIIHEFGHALGFPDENNRLDTYTSYNGSQSKSCRDLDNVGNPKIINGDLIFKKSVKSISHKEWQQQPYDSFSIMNECVFSYGYSKKMYDVLSFRSSTNLTFKDINKVQQYYGAPLFNESHLIRNDKFFTGLYLENNEFNYYENGAKHKEFNTIEKSKLDEQISYTSDTVYFSISSNNDVNEKKFVLFKSELNSDDSKFIEPVASILTTCDKPLIDEESPNSQKTIQLRNGCKTVESFAKDNDVTNNRSIYYHHDNYDSIIHMYYCTPIETDSADTTTEQLFHSGKDCLNLSDLIEEKVIFINSKRNNYDFHLYDN